MFKCDNPNLIQSDEGFSVRVLGQTGLLYQDQGHSLRINSEVLASPAGLVIYQSSIRNWDEPKGKLISDDARRLIIDNIRRAFAFRGIEIEVI